MVELMHAVIRQQRIDDGAERDDGDRGNDRLIAIGQLHRHDIARGDPRATELSGEPPGVPCEVCESASAPAQPVHDRGVSRPLSRSVQADP